MLCFYAQETYLLNIISLDSWKNELKRPIFVLWLEPYAIAGHLIYVSKTDGYKTFRNCFDAKGNYKYNMIATTEYENQHC